MVCMRPLTSPGFIPMTPSLYSCFLQIVPKINLKVTGIFSYIKAKIEINLLHFPETQLSKPGPWVCDACFCPLLFSSQLEALILLGAIKM